MTSGRSILAYRRRPIIGVALSLVGWAVMLAACVEFMYLLDAVLPPLDEGIGRTALRGGIALVLASIVYNTSRVVATVGRRMRLATAAIAMTRDRRPPIVYFRSFSEDRISYFSLTSTFEEVLAAVFHEVGPVVAIAHPDESLPPIGAARMPGGPNWQEKVRSLLDRAGAVIMRPGITPGVLWELNAAVQLSSPEKLLIAFPPSKDAQRERLYASFREATTHLFPRELPELIGRAQFIMFDENWVPRLSADETTPGMRPRAVTRLSLRPFFERLGRPLRKHRWAIEPEMVEIAVVLAVLYWVLFYSGPAWKTYRAPGFSVSLPSAPKETQQALSTPFGTITEDRVTARWRGAEYFVAYARLPQGQTAESVAETLDRARDEIVANMNGKLIRETRLNFGTSSGRDLVVEAIGRKTFVKCRILRVNDRLLEAVAVLPAAREYPLKNSRHVQTFFDSFKPVDERMKSEAGLP